jgi:hypothetical protein
MSNTAAMNPRTRMLLEAPIARTLIKLAVPNILVMGAQASAGQSVGAELADEVGLDQAG